MIDQLVRQQQEVDNLSAVEERFIPGGYKSGSIALVAYGPSLNETWEKAAKHPWIMTCSGAHKFLVDRGVIPTYHVEVDPRPHKVDLIGKPNKQTTYLLASSCHPALFKHLEGYNVKLWNVWEGTDAHKDYYRPGEWYISGGSSVGLRMLPLAYLMGFRDLHVYGLDFSFADQKHADAHPNPNEHKSTEVSFYGKTFKTTDMMIEFACQFFSEIEKLEYSKVKVHGESLLNHMVQVRLANPKPQEKREKQQIAFKL